MEILIITIATVLMFPAGVLLYLRWCIWLSNKVFK